MKRRPKPDAIDIFFAFYGKEISIAQLRARLTELGWSSEEIENGLDAQEDEVETDLNKRRSRWECTK